MGGLQTSETEKVFYEKLIFVRSLDNSKSLMKEPQTQDLFVVVEHTFPSELQMHKFSEQLRRKKQFSHQYYMSPIKQIVFSTSNLCSKQHKIVQIFNWQEYTLLEEIRNRKQENRKFSDRQIWSILCSCVLTMSYFTKNQVNHLTLNPKDIVLTNEGQVKILSYQISQYQFDYNYKHGFYYAPQTLKAINTKSLHNLSNKSSVFTLGVTILAVINVEDMTYLYKDGSTIDMNEVKRLIEMISNEDIKNVLVKMLKFHAYQRISFTQLQQMLFQILQNNQLFSQPENDQEHEQNQLSKLEDSIYRLKAKKEVTFQNSSISQFGGDQQDTPNTLSSANNVIDFQVMDEVDTNQKNFYQQKGNSKCQSTENFNPNNAKNSQPNPLCDKSNSIQISQSLKIVDENKKFDFLNNQRTSREIGPTYVTEQYNRGRYQGYKQNGMRHGYGTFYYQQGGKYSGQWFRNKMQGRGALYYTNGQLAYEGEWNLDQLHGYGVLYNQAPIYVTQCLDWKNLDRITTTWVKYEGNFAKDMKQGEGTLYLSNGEYFRGDFKNDQPCGKGIFRTVANQLIKGNWKNGAFESYER